MDKISLSLIEWVILLSASVAGISTALCMGILVMLGIVIELRCKEPTELFLDQVGQVLRASGSFVFPISSIIAIFALILDKIAF